MPIQVTSTVVGDLTNDEVWAIVDDILAKHEELKPRGIRVSNSLHQRGIEGEYRGIPIAMSPALYPVDQVQVEFEELV